MYEEHFVIKYVPVKNCFVYLSEILAKRLDFKQNGLKLSHKDNVYYVSWRPISGPDESLGISATFACAMNIKEGDNVVVSSVTDQPFLSSITVTPWKIEDWNIVEYQAERIQSILLDQISLIAKKQPIVIWISKGLSVTLSIDVISPDFAYGRIGNRTEVHVLSPRAPRNEGKSAQKTETVVDQAKMKFWNFFDKTETKEKPDGIETWLKNNEIRNIPQAFRVNSESAMKELYVQDLITFPSKFLYDVFTDESNVASNCSEKTKFCLYKIRKIHEDRQYVNPMRTDFLRTDDNEVPKMSAELVVRLFPLKKSLNGNERKDCLTNSLHKEIYVSTNLRQNLNLPLGSKVLLEPLVLSDQSVTSIDIYPSTPMVTREIFEKFVLTTACDSEILLNSRSRIHFDDGTSCMILCSSERSSYFLIDSVRLRKLAVNVGKVASVEVETSNDIEKEIEEINLTNISSLPLESIIAECRIVLELSLCLAGARNFRCEPENILICGHMGSGKTTLCKILRETMHKAPYFVHLNSIECKTLKGKRAEAMHKIMSAAMADCVYYQPSILFLDDLESITGSPSGEEENTPDAINASRILDAIFNIAADYQSSHYISIVATCTDANKIGPKLRSPRGVHLFRTVLTIPDLAKEHRIDILSLALRNHMHVPESINWDNYGNKTEGWVAQDLVDFAEKTAFAAWKRHVENKSEAIITLSEDDLSETFENYKTLSLHGVQLYKSSGQDWSNIGGLTRVKDILTQLLKWPLKYPDFYRNAPIKNQNGVLLYGMPGTGKTILAGAIAKECGVNLISVKGPELLSKYIGASEEAVRNVFEKARRAKPCVLFFDEFDSLAPRRGHDSTGVTDRVVNQLLTQLDGVEGREGVAVVAASSRPDLLDPALLRPGRLDKSLLCLLPDENDREAILKVLCKVQGIDVTNLDLKDLAKRSLGFTGADLNAVLTQAKYDALESALEEILPGQDTCIETIPITQGDLIASLNSTKPSLSKGEKEKYGRIYEQFSRGSIVESVAFMKQKATLA